MPDLLRKARCLLLDWLPVIVIGVLIFSASSDTGSFQRSSRIIGPFVKWLYPSISEPALQQIIFAVRKCAHMTEFGLFALFLWRALAFLQNQSRAWSRPRAWTAFLLSFAYACGDELHQVFVPTRQGSPWDVLIDSTGAALGLTLLWLWGKWRKRW